MLFDSPRNVRKIRRRCRNVMGMNENIIVVCALLIIIVVGGLFIHDNFAEQSAENSTDLRQEKRTSRPPRELERLSPPSSLRLLNRKRRGFRSYFYNYLDELAMAICASIPSEGPGLVYSVRRTCGENEEVTCKQICTDQRLRDQAPKEVQKLRWSCSESLHVYKRQPALADNYEEYTDSIKLGLAVYRHNSCNVAKCGPNYCCCRAVAAVMP